MSHVEKEFLNQMGARLKKHHSDLFNGWDVYHASNLEKQIKYLERSMEFCGFIQNGLNLYCGKRRHMTHGVVIYLKMAHELGKIAEFESYEVKTIEYIKNIFATEEVSKADLALINAEIDVHNCPKLIKSRLKYPKNIIMVTCFVDVHTYSARMVRSLLCDLSDFGHDGTVKSCKQDADTWFHDLQMIVKRMPANLVKEVKL